MMNTAGWALVVVAITLCQQPFAAGQWNPPWRPSYNVNASTITVSNSLLYMSLTYTQWQGYFNNTFVLPYGTCVGPLHGLVAQM